MSKPLVIYHGHCDDGFGAAYAVWKALGGNADYFAGTYGDDPPECADRDILLVDFSYKRTALEELAKDALTVTIIDHHKTAEEDLRGFVGSDMHADAHEFAAACAFHGVLPIRAEFDMHRSGAMMTWEHFHGRGTAPDLIRYIQDRDLWRKQLPNVDEFTIALRSYPQDFAVWDTLAVPQLITEGRTILRYYRQKIDETKRHQFLGTIGGFTVPVCNAPYFMASEIAGELAEGERFAACWYEDGTWRNFSLRSRGAEAIDVSEIAKLYGGGGHKNAAGFRVPCGGWVPE